MYLHQSEGSKMPGNAPFTRLLQRMGSLQSVGLSSAQWQMGCATLRRPPLQYCPAPCCISDMSSSALATKPGCGTH